MQEFEQPALFQGPSSNKVACCDCGLVHDLRFNAVRTKDHKAGTFTITEEDVPDMRVMFKARRNMRSTAQVRRHKNKP